MIDLLLAAITGILIGWGFGLAVADRSFRRSK